MVRTCSFSKVLLHSALRDTVNAQYALNSANETTTDYSIMATAEVDLQNEDKSDSDKKTIFRYRRLYDMFLFISILLLFINYFTVIFFKQDKVF